MQITMPGSALRIDGARAEAADAVWLLPPA